VAKNITIKVDTTVDVDVDLGDFDDDDLIEEIESRGYVVDHVDYVGHSKIDNFQIDALIKYIGEQKIGSDLWKISEKLYEYRS